MERARRLSLLGMMLQEEACMAAGCLGSVEGHSHGERATSAGGCVSECTTDTRASASGC
jgi:hypothetical protein